MLYELDCVRCRGRPYIAWQSFLKSTFPDFPDEVRVKNNPDFDQPLMAFRYSNICYCKVSSLPPVRPQHSALMSLRADFICSWKHIHAKSRRIIDIKIMRDFHFVFDPILWKAFTSTKIKTASNESNVHKVEKFILIMISNLMFFETNLVVF